MALDETPYTPDWWLIQLGKRLRERQPQITEWRNYYKGTPELPTGPEGAVEAYRDFQRKSRTNFLAFAARSTSHRLEVIGVTDANGKPLDKAWKWWTQNRFEARQKQLYRASLSLSEAYVMVGEHPKHRRQPLLTVEHPSEVIVYTDPATGERLAALKTWWDDLEKKHRANVLLPDTITRYESVRRGRYAAWSRQSWAPLGDPEPHRYGGVPVVPFPCTPEAGESPEPDFAAGIPIQDRINLSMLNRMTAERYSAFRQKYVTGHKFTKVTDPETGLPILDQDGQPKVKNPFRPHPGALWASTGEQTKFGEFSETNLLNYLKVHQSSVLDLLTLTHTPAYYYTGDLINVATDTVLAMDINHISKVEEYATDYGAAFADVHALCAAIADPDMDTEGVTVRWKNPRQLNPALLADVATKKHAIGYPLGIIAEDLGESPSRIKRIEQGQARQAMMQARLQPSFQAPGAPRNGGGRDRDDDDTRTGRGRNQHTGPGAGTREVA